jgi:succinoglycan biosynthesis protein ExoM
VAGGFFDRPSHLNGQIIHYATTSNVLIAHSVLATHDPPFHPAYGLSGGEDTHFFMRAVLEGFRIAWADRAVVTETFPPDRVRWSWLVTREYRRGNTLSLCLRDLQDSSRRRVRRAVRGVLEIILGTAVALTAVRQGRQSLLRGMRQVALGAGMLTGLARVRFRPYGPLHETSRLAALEPSRWGSMPRSRKRRSEPRISQ